MRYYVDEESAFQYPNGSVAYYTHSVYGFRSLARVDNCPCEDGSRRRVHITSEPDSFSSVPAMTYAKGKSISGFVTGDSGAFEDAPEGLRFVAYAYRKNGHLLQKG